MFAFVNGRGLVSSRQMVRALVARGYSLEDARLRVSQARLSNSTRPILYTYWGAVAPIRPSVARAAGMRPAACDLRPE